MVAFFAVIYLRSHNAISYCKERSGEAISEKQLIINEKDCMQ